MQGENALFSIKPVVKNVGHPVNAREDICQFLAELEVRIQQVQAEVSESTRLTGLVYDLAQSMKATWGEDTKLAVQRVKAMLSECTDTLKDIRAGLHGDNEVSLARIEPTLRSIESFIAKGVSTMQINTAALADASAALERNTCEVAQGNHTRAGLAQQMREWQEQLTETASLWESEKMGSPMGSRIAETPGISKPNPIDLTVPPADGVPATTNPDVPPTAEPGPWTLFASSHAPSPRRSSEDNLYDSSPVWPTLPRQPSSLEVSPADEPGPSSFFALSRAPSPRRSSEENLNDPTPAWPTLPRQPSSPDVSPADEPGPLIFFASSRAPSPRRCSEANLNDLNPEWPTLCEPPSRVGEGSIGSSQGLRSWVDKGDGKSRSSAVVSREGDGSEYDSDAEARAKWVKKQVGEGITWTSWLRSGKERP